MNTKTFTRRSLVRGTGGIVMGIPFLESLVSRQAKGADAIPPKRFVIFNHPEGATRPLGGGRDFTNEWQPAAGTSRTNFELAPLMQPMAAFKNRMIVTRGIDNTAAGIRPKDHVLSTRNILTGGAPTSIDQTIAKRVGSGFRFASLEFGVASKQARVIYDGGSPVPCVNDPRQMFQRLFTVGGGGTPIDDAAFMRLLARRKSVIDAVKVQFDSLQREVSGDDRQRLEAHLSAVRQAEKELLPTGSGPQPPVTSGDCKNPQFAATGRTLADITKQQIDLMVLALACRLTPVASLQWSQTGCQENFSWLGNPVGDFLHTWVHNLGSSEAYVEQWRAVQRWFAGQMAYLLGKMDQINEGGRTLLDNSAVVFVSSFGVAGDHDPANAPFVIAGSAGGALRTGQFLDYANPGVGGRGAKQNKQTNNQLFMALAKAFGIDMPSYGDARHGTTPLADILA